MDLFDSDNASQSHRRQTIIWTNNTLIYSRIYATLILNES